jgi:putative inorganic carbon (HCO3(-)) transporter
LSDFLAGFGLIVAALAAAGAILLPPERPRAVAILTALVLFPALVLGDQWHTHQIVDLRDHPSRLAALAIAGLLISGVLAYAFRRWPIFLPLAVVAALPFRVPLHAGGDTANLLVPLYLVIAGGVLSAAFREWHEGGGVDPGAGFFAGRRASLAKPIVRKTGRRPQIDPPALLPCLLAGFVLLYGLQTLYSPDFSKGLQNVCFFFVPFSLAYGLLRDVEWDRKLLVCVLWVIGIEAGVFVLIGTVEHFAHELFWNDQVIRSNEFHTYFRVNSVFWDPNIYGRYLALVAVVAMTALLWARERRDLILLTGLVLVLWIGLVPTYSQSSFAALLAGLAVLAALKWSLRWTLAAVGIFAVLGILVVLLAGGSSKISTDRINIDTSGRANLVSGGIHLFSQRPIYGYGSGSFPKAYREHVRTHKAPVSVSHTEPVTIAAEQGLLGLTLYAALVLTGLWTMGSGLWRRRPAGPVAAGDPPPPAVAKASSGAVPPTAPPAGGASSSVDGVTTRLVARAAVLAVFVALLVHTMAYAGFYEDPITWVLLATAVSLAATHQRRAEPCPDTSAA